MAAKETTFEALGKVWRFKFGFNALCALEEGYDKPFIEILTGIFPDLDPAAMLDQEKLLAAVVNVRAVDFRAAFMAGLSDAHSDLTLAEVGNLIDEIGAEKAGEIIKAAVAQDLGGGESTGNPPPKARRSA